MDARKLDVLRAIVADYVSSREPVGSKALVDRHGLKVSSATVRNDMAVLEEEGYIAQPHTSAGRVPTDKGYRLFVDRLSEIKPLSAAERRAIQQFLTGAFDVDEIVARTVRLLAQLTQQVAVMQYPVLDAASVRHVDLISLSTERVMVMVVTSAGRVEQRQIAWPDHTADDLDATRTSLASRVLGRTVAEAGASLAAELEDLVERREPTTGERAAVATLIEMVSAGTSSRVVVGGVGNLARFGPEFSATMAPVLEALEEQVVLMRLFGEADADREVVVRIGAENPVTPLQSTSIVSSAYGTESGGMASLGVVGPTSMDYAGTMASVRAVAAYVGRHLGG